MTPNVERYRVLKKRELELCAEVIRTQSEDTEKERVQVALEREDLLFEIMTDEEVVEIGRNG